LTPAIGNDDGSSIVTVLAAGIIIGSGPLLTFSDYYCAGVIIYCGVIVSDNRVVLLVWYYY